MSFNTKLQKVLLNAYKNVPYYNKLFNDAGVDVNKIDSYESFEKIPLLDKKDIRNEPNSFINKNISFNRLHCTYTSGSTGIMLPVYWITEDKIKSEVYLSREREQIGYNGYKRKCLSCLFDVKYSTVQHSEICENTKYDKGKNRIYFDASKLSDKDCYNYFQTIKSYSPEVVFGTPSILYVFATFILENGFQRDFNVEYIEVFGEFLSDSCRKRIKQCFEKAMIINEYGCREAGAIAIEHGENKMYCISDNAYVEVLKEGKPVKNGEEGEVYITSLTNSAMPVIRYRIGDRGCLYEEKNEFGDEKKRLTIFSGRECDPIILKDKSTIGSPIFWLIINDVNKSTNDDIQQFSVIQTDYDKFIINLVLGKNDENCQNRIKILFEQYLKNYINCSFELDFVFHNKIIPSVQSGKLKYFVRMFD